MQPTQDTYPVFEANQVLTNAHLNQVFNYLDEQERLTRANLVGIGIVCGLNIRLEAGATPTIHLSKGCGITSEGYLLVEPEDVALVSYRAGYQVPNEVAYPPFKDKDTKGIPYPLWELFPADVPNTKALNAPANFLADKAVLLFLELKKEGLRNCSPNNCDDKGALVQATVRRLLIRVDDLGKILKEANDLGPDLTLPDLEASLLDRLNLPDLRLPRYDVPNTGPTTSKDVLAAFLAVFKTDTMVQQMDQALTKAYQAFRPVVKDRYPSNPFTSFKADFIFLENAPATTTQVRFLPYYYDFFGDLLNAYDEFRWKGVDLLCACCPPAGWFPRHLTLGLLFPASVTNPGIYRQDFLSSGAISGCEALEKEVKHLFQRLVEMIAQFTNTPLLPPMAGSTDTQIRLTPSQLADVPLSAKAIPYYYRQTGTPPLFQLWNAERTRRKRAHQNLSYRSDEFTPPAPTFVTDALRYDLEPYNFLRVEGHLGKNYQSALYTLISLKSRYRLPIEIIALRTGAFDESTPLDLSKEAGRFEDLETLYDTLRVELTCRLCKEVQYFYSLPWLTGASFLPPPIKATLPLLAQCAPDLLVQPQTLGWSFEEWRTTQPGGVLPDIDLNSIINLLNQQQAGQLDWIIFYVVLYASKLFDQLAPGLNQLVLADLEKRYQDLVSLTGAIEKKREQAVGSIQGNVNLLKWEELDDRLEEIIYLCRLDAFQSLHEEYRRRIKEVKQKQFLSHFLKNHPGIQHKAGVPLGGTLILVYHQEPAPLPPGQGAKASGTQFLTTSPVTADASWMAGRQMNTGTLSAAFARISANQALAADPDIRFLVGTFTGQIPDLSVPPVTSSGASQMIAKAIAELADGSVIADFYLPYRCGSDGASVQFVLPKVPPTFTVQIGCTNANKQAEVTLKPQGLAPFSVKVDKQNYQPLKGVLLLEAGPHTLVIRDAEATESAPQEVTLAQPLALDSPTFNCIANQNKYIAVTQISGGTPPYQANRGTVAGNTYTSDALPGDTDVEIILTDSRQCTVAKTVRHSCLPPLAFTVQLDCTTGNVASAKILPTGGKAPYEVQVGPNSPFTAINNPVQLTAGPHEIVVRDAVKTLTPLQTIHVPTALTLKTDLTCVDKNNYQATIQIQGGTPPYTANGAAVIGNLFKTNSIASKTTFSVEVKDQRNCVVTTQLQHACEEQCTLRRCAYPLWLQPPIPIRYNTFYNTYQQDDSNIRLRFNSKNMDLPNTAGLLNLSPSDLNSNFSGTMKKAIEQLNAAIQTALVDFGKNRLVISYQPAGSDPFGILLIEHFVSDTFNIEFGYSFAKSISGPINLHHYTVQYTNEPSAKGVSFSGTIFTNPSQKNLETRVLAFDCSERDQCGKEPNKYQKFCPGTEAKPDIKISNKGSQFSFTGTVDNVRPEEIIAWIWHFPDAETSEPVYTGPEISLPLSGPSLGYVRLTVITERGCFVTKEKSILQDAKP